MSEDTPNGRTEDLAPASDDPQEGVAALQSRAADLEQQLAVRLQELENRNAEMKGLREQLSGAAFKYRALLLAGNPEVPQELVAGDSIPEVEASFQAAREVVGRIKKQLEARMAADRVPPGAPARSAPDLSQLSPREKIAHALAQR